MHRRMGGLDELGNKGADTDTKVKDLEETVEELNEKIWELDKSWKNNLVFYGVREDAGVDEHPAITENKVNYFFSFFATVCLEFSYTFFYSGLVKIESNFMVI